MQDPEISIEKAHQLLRESKNLFTTVFRYGTLEVEIYKPDKVDHQQPHDRDEVYVIISGTGTFHNGGRSWQFKPGDFLFVPAGVEHQFKNFSADFSTWVFFYGPVGGEAGANPSGNNL
jgi:mannose-6-phosphate isomerase-like protein (cupin superfamily)